MKNTLVLLAFMLTALLGPSVFSQETVQKLYRIHVDDFSRIRSIESRGITVVDMKPGRWIDVLALPEQVRDLGIDGIRVEFIADSFKDLYQDQQQLKTSPPFHDYQSMLEEMVEIASGHPEIAELDTIGLSLAGRAILCLKISDNPATDEDEPPILIVGNHHGNEVQSVEATLYQVNFLVDRYGLDQEVTDWVNGMEFWFVPMVNPDGRMAMRRTNDHDVDLNRNYSVGFTPGGSHGPEAFSEPETRAVRDLAARFPPIMSLTYHTSGQYVLYSWTHTDLAAPDSAALVYLGALISNSIAGEHGDGTYTLLQGGRWYFTAGEYNDYLYATHNTLSYTVEMGTSQDADYSLVPEMVESNLNGMKTMLRQVNRAGVTGQVTDAATGLPVRAEIGIPSIDDQGKLLPRMSDSLYGRYYRYLAPGRYTLEITAPGYQSVTREITVSADSLTRWNIALENSAYLEFTGLRIIDTGGNLNGILDNGETAAVQLFVTNTGRRALNGLQADIRSEDPYIQIIPDQNLIEYLGAGASCTFTLTATVSPDAPENHTARCIIDILASEGYRTALIFQLQNFLGFFDDFESGAAGWTHQSYGTTENVQDDWQLGTPAGRGGDPDRAYSGSNSWGNDLGWDSYQGTWWDGLYQGNVYNYLRSPVIDCSGFSGTGLKLMRWLNTKLNDLGRIKVNNVLVWESPDQGIHDSVWTRQVIDISAVADNNPEVTLTFELRTNRAVHDGGWNIDDVVVASGLFAGSSIDETEISRAPVVLSDAFPSPFNSMTIIKYYIRDGGPVELTIIDQAGRTIHTLVNGDQCPGFHEIAWYGNNTHGQAAPPGTYFYKLSAGKTTITKRLVLLR